MANLPKLRQRLRKRARRRQRQYEAYKKTGNQKNLKWFRIHRRAARKLRRLIEQAIRLQSFASPNFRYSEFNCHDGRQVPGFAHKGLDHLCQFYLEPLRGKFGAIHVTSGYRPRDYNARIGGASMSVHIYDYPGRDGSAVAADVICRTGSPQQWGEYLASIGADGIGIYNSSGFVHCDNRTRMGWPKSSGFGN